MRYSLGGRPVELTGVWLAMLRGEIRGDYTSLVTEQSRSTWERFFESEWEAAEYVRRAHGDSTMVRHPGPGIAYVFCLIGHPDQTEPFTIEKQTKASVDVLTLLYDSDIHDCRVHQFGAPTPSEAVGLASFPRRGLPRSD